MRSGDRDPGERERTGAQLGRWRWQCQLCRDDVFPQPLVGRGPVLTIVAGAGSEHGGEHGLLSTGVERPARAASSHVACALSHAPVLPN